MQRVSVNLNKPENGGPMVFRDDPALAHALRLHDQMLATVGWVIEQTTMLDPDLPSLDPLYDAYDFLAALREHAATADRRPG